MSRKIVSLVTLIALAIGVVAGHMMWPKYRYFNNEPEEGWSEPEICMPADHSDGPQKDLERMMRRLAALQNPVKIAAQTFCPLIEKECGSTACRRNLALYTEARRKSAYASQLDAMIRKITEAAERFAKSKGKTLPDDDFEKEVLASFDCAANCGKGKTTCPLPCLGYNEMVEEEGADPPCVVKERAAEWRYICPPYCAFCGEEADKPACPIDCIDCN